MLARLRTKTYMSTTLLRILPHKPSSQNTRKSALTYQNKGLFEQTNFSKKLKTRFCRSIVDGAGLYPIKTYSKQKRVMKCEI